MRTALPRLVVVLVVGLVSGKCIAQSQSGPPSAPPGTPGAHNSGSVPDSGNTPVNPSDSKKDKSGSKSQSITDLVIDLANPEPTSAVTPGAYRLKLINKLPMADYQITSKVTSNAIPPPIDLSGKQSQPTPSPSPENKALSPCQQQEALITQALNGAMCESQVAEKLGTVRSVLTATSCTDSEISAFQSDLADMTTRTDGNALPVVADGDELDVKIARDAFYTQAKASGKCQSETIGPPPNGLSGSTVASRPLGTWHFDFGKKQAQWLTYYGFNFTHNGDDSYYSKANQGSNPASYTITAEANRQSSNFSASIYVMRLPAEDGFTFKKILGWREDDWMGGLTAGLGFDFSNPTVFLGYGVGWGYNVIVTAGVEMQQVTRLKGQYNAGDVITTNLTPDQLVDSTYRPQAYIGIAIRLGSNPFNGSNSSKSSTTSKTTTSNKSGS